jgi:hypothetical protein
MAYTLQALIAKVGVLRVEHLAPLHVVRLNDEVEMLPLASELRTRFRVDFLPLTDDGASDLPPGLAHFCRELSVGGMLAYVEAELFGGSGTQAYALFENGHATATPVVGESAINQALRKLGVCAASGIDEFEHVGLGKHRDTEGWLE